jgi:hypothetical protein
MESLNIVIDRNTTYDIIDIFDKKKDIYKLYEYMNYLILTPKDNKYEYSLFFFSGFNENAGKYIYLLKPFFENFTKVSKIKFKIILPMLKKVSRDLLTKSNFVDYNDYRYEYVFTWNILIKDENLNRIGFYTFNDLDEIVKELINNEIKILGNQDKIIFCGFSMGGRYMTYVLENMNIKTKFNLIFKSPITIYNIKNEKNYNTINKLSLREYNYKSLNKDILSKGDYLKNKFYLLYSINDKLLNLNEGLLTYQMIKNEFYEVKMKIDNGRKHIVDYNCLEYLKEILIKEIVNNKSKF